MREATNRCARAGSSEASRHRPATRAAGGAGDAGASTVEHLGLLLVIAAVVIVLAPLLGPAVTAGVGRAICGIFGGPCAAAPARQARPPDFVRCQKHGLTRALGVNVSGRGVRIDTGGSDEVTQGVDPATGDPIGTVRLGGKTGVGLENGRTTLGRNGEYDALVRGGAEVTFNYDFTGQNAYADAQAYRDFRRGGIIHRALPTLLGAAGNAIDEGSLWVAEQAIRARAALGGRSVDMGKFDRGPDSVTIKQEGGLEGSYSNSRESGGGPLKRTRGINPSGAVNGSQELNVRLRGPQAGSGSHTTTIRGEGALAYRPGGKYGPAAGNPAFAVMAGASGKVSGSVTGQVKVDFDRNGNPVRYTVQTDVVGQGALGGSAGTTRNGQGKQTGRSDESTGNGSVEAGTKRTHILSIPLTDPAARAAFDRAYVTTPGYRGVRTVIPRAGTPAETARNGQRLAALIAARGQEVVFDYDVSGSTGGRDDRSARKENDIKFRGWGAGVENSAARSHLRAGRYVDHTAPGLGWQPLVNCR